MKLIGEKYVRRIKLLFCLSCCSIWAFTQHRDSTVNELQQVIIKAYQQNVRLMDMPAAIGYASPSLLNRWSQTSIVQSLNTLPGIQMEERSPSSYRLNIRSSSLRSPFGVRNIKVYYNDIPFTDPGGNTFLNQLGFYNFRSVELVKGPGSSLYGAGNGGAMLISSFSLNDSAKLKFDAQAGSYGLQSYHAGWRMQKSTALQEIQVQHLTSRGYRDQSGSHHDNFSWHSRLVTSPKNELSADLLFSDLYYQTPGGLTLAEFNKDPRAARPHTSAAPGAAEANAAIFQQNLLVGLKDQYQLNDHLSASVVAYYAYAQMKNPGIRNYGDTREPHEGGRAMLDYVRRINQVLIKWQSGVEYQLGNFREDTYQNKRGQRDSLLSDDRVKNRQSFLFTQLTAHYRQWTLTAGLSLSTQEINIHRIFPVVNHYERSFEDQLSPRVAVLRKLGENLSVYANFAKGFSPPAVAEILPTGGPLNSDLQPEIGNNYEGGIRVALLKKHLLADASIFYFTLQNAIVQRRDAAGGDYYLNAGSTRQDGAEMSLQYHFRLSSAWPENMFWVSGSLYDFRYRQFKEINNDCSDNNLPGIAKDKFSAGLNMTGDAWSASLVYSYTGQFYLDDANKNSSTPVHLISVRLNHGVGWGRNRVNIFAGVENLLNESYSLGYDINAAGGRFYNAAPTRNFFGGINFQLF